MSKRTLFGICIFAGVSLCLTLRGDAPLENRQLDARDASRSSSFRSSVVALAAKIDSKIDYATGSVVQFNDECYLLTATHFAKGDNGRIIGTVFSRSESGGGTIGVMKLAQAGADWQHFEEFDLSVLKLRRDCEELKYVTVWLLPDPIKDKPLTTLSPVHIIGVPLFYGVSPQTGVNPTVLRTEVANSFVNPRESLLVKSLLLPVALPEGYSGGIVVDALQDRGSQDTQTLRGIVVRSTSNDRGGQFSLAVSAEVLTGLLSTRASE